MAMSEENDDKISIGSSKSFTSLNEDDCCGTEGIP